jgi:hypothetical protein
MCCELSIQALSIVASKCVQFGKIRTQAKATLITMQRRHDEKGGLVLGGVMKKLA